MNDMIRRLEEPAFLDALYRYAYRRCNTSFEAEDLCSEITLRLLRALRRGAEVRNFEAFARTVAHRTYADFCARRKRDRDALLPDGDAPGTAAAPDPIDALVDADADAALLRRILREISFLSRIHREVMVLYYLEEKSAADIARTLHISEAAVRQRLFSARNIIKKEVQTMEKTVSLQPIILEFIGTGQPLGNDPSEKVERALSKNLLYLCRREARSAKELSEQLQIPMPYIEEEIEIQLHGCNGTYGTLADAGNGKYIANILLPTPQEYQQAIAAYTRQLPDLCAALQDTVERNRQRILSFPYRSRQDNLSLPLWLLIHAASHTVVHAVRQRLQEAHFPCVTIPRRAFSVVGLTGQPALDLARQCYGMDGIEADAVAGFRHVSVSNLYSDRLEAHFHCDHNLATDPLLLLTLRSLDGLEAASLDGEGKEIAAKAIACGYLQKRGDRLLPKIVVLDAAQIEDFYGLLTDWLPDAAVKAIAAELADIIRKVVPRHLLGDYAIFNQLIASVRFTHDLLEACIETGLLAPPTQPLSAAGVLMTVTR